MENENNNTKTTSVPRVQFIDMENYPCWLKLSLTGTNFHGSRPIRAIEFLL